MKKYPLKTVIFEIERNCNLDCVYCYNHWKPSTDGIVYPEKRKFSIAKSTLKKFFDQAEISHVTFSGGEPFLFKRLQELVLFSRMKKKAVTVITNGYAAKPADLENFRRMGVGLFELPVQSFAPEIHDKMAGLKGAWSRSVGTIKELLRLGIPTAAVIVLTRFNFRDIEKTMVFIKDLGVRNILVNRYNIGGKNRANWKELSLRPEELKEVFRMMNDWMAVSGLKISSGVCTPVCILDPMDYPHIAFGHCGDTPENMPVALDVFGNIRFCNHSPTVIGNIHRNSLSEIFERPESKKWLRTFPESCSDCRDLDRCKGGCRAASEQVFGSNALPDPYLQLIK